MPSPATSFNQIAEAARDDAATFNYWVGYGNLQQVERLLQKHGLDIFFAATTKNGYTPLMSAAQRDNIAMMQLMQKYGVGLNDADGQGRTALQVAALFGHLDAVKFLVGEGVNPNGPQILPVLSPLMTAAQGGHVDVAQFLIDRDVDVNLRSWSGKTALMHSVKHPKMVKLLIDNDADVNFRDGTNDNALHWAVDGGSVESVRILLDHDADYDAIDDNNQTPLELAKQMHDPEMAEVITAVIEKKKMEDRIAEERLKRALTFKLQKNVKIPPPLFRKKT